MSTGIRPVAKWSEILDEYEVFIEQPGYVEVFMAFADAATSPEPVYDVVSEDVRLVYVADSKDRLREEIEKNTPEALRKDVLFLSVNWAFINSKYRALNYNGKRITIAGIMDDMCYVNGTDAWSQSFVPSIHAWYTCLVKVNADGKNGTLSVTEGDETFCLAFDNVPEAIAVIESRPNGDDMVAEFVSHPDKNFASISVIKAISASDGLFYRGVPYRFADIIDEAIRCEEKLGKNNESSLEMLRMMRKEVKGGQA